MRTRQETIQILGNNVEREEYCRQKKQTQATEKKEVSNILPHPAPVKTTSYRHKRKYAAHHKQYGCKRGKLINQGLM